MVMGHLAHRDCTPRRIVAVPAVVVLFLIAGACESMRTSGCHSHDECPKGQSCVAGGTGVDTGVCQADTGCMFNGKSCPLGTVCYRALLAASECAPGCGTSENCPAGNYCEVDQTPCLFAQACGSTTKCVPGCRDDTECARGLGCHDGRCAAPCTPNSGCPSVGGTWSVCVPTKNSFTTGLIAFPVPCDNDAGECFCLNVPCAVNDATCAAISVDAGPGATVISRDAGFVRNARAPDDGSASTASDAH